MSLFSKNKLESTQVLSDETSDYLFSFVGETYSALATSLLAHPLYEALIDSLPFRRLFSIPFLGIHGHFDESNQYQTRGHHSLTVAMLTIVLARMMKLSRHQEMLSVASALLHDIHHLPFSHTMDFPVKNEISKFSFDRETTKIIHQRPNQRGRSIRDILDEWGIETSELPIFKEEKVSHWMFMGTHNVDTLDGIARCWQSMFDPKTECELPIDLVQALAKGYRKGNLSFEEVTLFDKFWELKHKVYVHGIYNPVNFLFERLAGYYLFDLAQEKGMLGDLTCRCDADFFDAFPELLDRLSGLRRAVNQLVRFTAEEESIEPSWNRRSSHADLKLAMVGRWFRVDPQHAFVFPTSLTEGKRYTVRKHELLVLLPSDFARVIEEILDYPLVHRRIKAIAQDAGERLI